MTDYILAETVLFGGKFKFYYLPDDKYVGQRIALGKYEPYETELILRQVKTGDVIVDVGANIGYYTVILAKKVGKTGKVYAFEPDPINFSILKKNIEANNLKNVTVVQSAISDNEGVLELYKSEENFGDHRIYKGSQSSGSNTQKVKTIKLDDYFKNQPSFATASEGRRKIDLIKIDTQGWEPKVVEGAKKIIEKNKPVIFF